MDSIWCCLALESIVNLQTGTLQWADISYSRSLIIIEVVRLFAASMQNGVICAYIKFVLWFFQSSTHSMPSTQSLDQNHTLDHTFHERKGQAAAAKPRSPSLDSVNQSYLIGHNGIFTIPYEMCAPTKGDRKILGTNTPLFTKDIQEIHQWLVGLNTTFICSEEGKLAVRMIYRT